MADEIEWTPVRVRLGDLAHWAENPVTLTKAQAKKLLKSTERLGRMQTLAIGPPNGDGKYPLYDGHQRANIWGGAFGMGLEVNALQSNRPLTDEERHAVPIMLRTAAGSLDYDILAGWTDWPITEWGLDADLLSGLKCDIAALGNLLESEETEPADAEPQIDRAEELQEKWKVVAGNVWRIGEHVIICGDCREPDTWTRLLAAAGVGKVNGVFTSPPYAEQRKAQYGGVPTDEYVEWWDAVQSNVRANLAGDGSFFVNIKPHCEGGERVLYVFDLVLAMRRKWGWRFVDELCWLRRGYPGDYKGRFRNAFEPVYHFADSDFVFHAESVAVESSVTRGHSPSKSQYAHADRTIFGAPNWAEDTARPSNVLDIKCTDSGVDHYAPFPVALPSFFVRAYSDAGDIWLDPFLGSGTTIVAAHNEGRRGLGIERLEKYVAVAIERMATAFPGIEIERIEST